MKEEKKSSLETEKTALKKAKDHLFNKIKSEVTDDFKSTTEYKKMEERKEEEIQKLEEERKEEEKINKEEFIKRIEEIQSHISKEKITIDSAKDIRSTSLDTNINSEKINKLENEKKLLDTQNTQNKKNIENKYKEKISKIRENHSKILEQKIQQLAIQKFKEEDIYIIEGKEERTAFAGCCNNEKQECIMM